LEANHADGRDSMPVRCKPPQHDRLAASMLRCGWLILIE
jgi:hypothetical protein